MGTAPHIAEISPSLRSHVEHYDTSSPITLRKRLILLLLRWFVVFFVIALVVGGWMLTQVRSWMTEGHRLLAETVAEYVDATLTAALRDLERIPTELGELDSSAGPRLRAARLRSVFNQSIYILDEQGEIVISDPALARPPDREWRLSVVGHSGVLSRGDHQPVLAAMRSFRRGGELYTLVAEAQSAGSGLSVILQDLASDPSLHIVVVNTNGRVIAAPDQRQVSGMMHTISGLVERIRANRPLVAESTHCPLCAYGGAFEGRNLTVMVPLDVAPWAIVVQQHEPTVLSLAETFLAGFVGVTTILGLMGLLLSRSFSQSVIHPIHDLSMQAARMREGDLESPITTRGDQEMIVLAGSLDDARRKIAESMEELRRLNEGLELVVAERTTQLIATNERRQELVRQLLRAGEEERRRIARELHDEISQLLTVIQMSLEQIAEKGPAGIARTQELLIRTQKEIHNIIHDLRPTLLDDLGLAAAVKWYADSDLASAGITVTLDLELPEDLDLPEEVEITVFRILQECITNILRHARAQNVCIELYGNETNLVLMVEDDGHGFDPDRRYSGAGLTGMRERAALVGGVIRVDSEPDQGTTVQLTIPLGASV